jgi:hypothetical protein
VSVTEQRLRILKMIELKQITPEEGAELLAAITAAGAQSTSAAEGQRSKWFRVRVTDIASGRVRANVTIPLGLIDVGLKMGARFAPDVSGMDLTAIQAAIRGGMRGRILDVQDDDENERVEIFVE